MSSVQKLFFLAAVMRTMSLLPVKAPAPSSAARLKSSANDTEGP